MLKGNVLLRCGSCGAVNRVPSEKLADRPKCGKCKNLLDYPRSPVEVADWNFDQEVLSSPGAVLVFFWAPWCAHCMGMFPLIEHIARTSAGLLKVVSVNTEKAAGVARRYSVMAVPRLALYRHGELVGEINGAVSEPQLEAWLASRLP